MVSCSSSDAACPPGFMTTWVLIVGVMAVFFPLMTWFMVRRIKAQMAADDLDDGGWFGGRGWPLFGPLPRRRVRQMARMGKWSPWLAPGVAGLFLAIGLNSSGPPELKAAIALFVPVWAFGFGGMPWFVRRAVLESGGIARLYE